MRHTISIWRTLAAGLAGGIAFVLGTFVTFRLLGGSRLGAEGLLFDPDTQHPKVITVWKELEPLPRILENPLTILGGMLAFGIGYAFVYRSIAPAWTTGLHSRAWRLGLIVWLGTVFAEFMGPFNVLHQPLNLSVLAWAMWAVCAFAEAYALVFVLDRGLSKGREQGEHGPAHRSTATESHA
ncbi:hypothetical protein [Micromonospora sp. IBHARD004]|uniref:hypothetical protein n=1 Tax=Micromonospora sp. IBHARD004 TaxID=3457764 RepID=UPI004057DABD